MRLIARPLAPGETNAELLGLTISSGAAAAFALWHALHLPWPVCAFHIVTGQPCPTCGATRAAIALLHGDLPAAWNWNPLALLAYGAVVLFDGYVLVVMATGAKRLRIVQVRPGEKKFLRASLVAVVLCNWVYLLIAKAAA